MKEFSKCSRKKSGMRGRKKVALVERDYSNREEGTVREDQEEGWQGNDSVTRVVGNFRSASGLVERLDVRER
jgi:hypothetical protein